jgi:hypothetical protein
VLLLGGPAGKRRNPYRSFSLRAAYALPVAPAERRGTMAF